MGIWDVVRGHLRTRRVKPVEMQGRGTVPRRAWADVPFSRRPWRWRRRRGRYAITFQTELPFGLPLGSNNLWGADIRQLNEFQAVTHETVRISLGSSSQPPELPQHLSVLPNWNAVLRDFAHRALPQGRTLAEFVVAPAKHWEPTDEILTRCFDQGLEALNRLIAEYSIATMDPEVHEVSKEELPALALVTFKDLKAPYYAHTILRLHRRDSVIKERLPTSTFDRIAARVDAPASQGGMHAFHIQRVRADRLIHQGSYSECVIAASIAIEALVAWLVRRRMDELGRERESIERLFERKGILGVVRSDLHPWLGGRWDAGDARTAAGQWRRHIHDVRTRVVHGGYRPNYREAGAALDAGKVISAYSFERLRETGRATWLDPPMLVTDPLRGSYYWEEDRWVPTSAD